MSHFITEVIIPPTPAGKIKSAISQVLAPFNESRPEDMDTDVSPGLGFWDWWRIGARFFGTKWRRKHDPDGTRTKAFQEAAFAAEIGYRASRWQARGRRAGPTRQDRRPLARALPGGRDRRVRPGPARATPWTTDSAPAT